MNVNLFYPLCHAQFAIEALEEFVSFICHCTSLGKDSRTTLSGITETLWFNATLSLLHLKKKALILLKQLCISYCYI